MDEICEKVIWRQCSLAQRTCSNCRWQCCHLAEFLASLCGFQGNDDGQALCWYFNLNAISDIMAPSSVIGSQSAVNEARCAKKVSKASGSSSFINVKYAHLFIGVNRTSHAAQLNHISFSPFLWVTEMFETNFCCKWHSRHQGLESYVYVIILAMLKFQFKKLSLG